MKVTGGHVQSQGQWNAEKNEARKPAWTSLVNKEFITMVTRIMQEMQEMVGKQDRSILHTWGHYPNTGIA